MTAVQDAYQRLSTAMLHITPACNGIDMFTSDDLDHEDRQMLKAICDTCPLLQACGDYARIARPPAGFWPGIGTKKRSTK